MENSYLLELISEASARGGGLLLNYNNKPAAVVMTVEKYNQLLGSSPETARQPLNQVLPLTDNSQPAPGPLPAVPVPHGAKRILITGGAGYIGAHLSRQLLQEGYEVIVLDNLSTGKRENVPAGAAFIEGDLGDANLLKDLFAASRIDAVMHMAASIEVEESTRFPERYLENNAIKTARLLEAMSEAGVKKIIFSSTAAVYGQQEKLPITERAAAHPNNPYGFSKLLAEKIIKYHCLYSGFKAVVFRYFNACGCDFDGSIKPTHQSHLIPIVLEVAKGLRPHLLINGNDYNTHDGTAVRDYVHVLDIAGAHVKALETMDSGENFRIYNIGTSRGCSVMDITNGAAEILNRIIPMEIGPRRDGDAPATVADNTKLRQELGYELLYSDLETIITTSWKQMGGER